MDSNVDEFALDGATDDRQAHDGGEHLREERNNIDVQHEAVTFFARLLGIASVPARQPAFDAGVAALAGHRLDEALAHFATALDDAATGSERALIHNKRALTHLQRGDRTNAVACFVEALEADPRCVAVIVNVGNLLLEDGVVGEAIAHYEAALRVDDEYGPAHLNLGIAYKRLGFRADAVREFRRANRIEARLRARRP